MDALVQQLDSYSRLGIPKLQHSTINFEAEDEVEEGKLIPSRLINLVIPFEQNQIIIFRPKLCPTIIQFMPCRIPS